MKKMILAILLLVAVPSLQAVTPTFTVTPSNTPTPSSTATPSATPTKTVTVTSTPSPTTTRTITVTITVTSTITTTRTPSASPTFTVTATPKPNNAPQVVQLQPNGTPVPVANTFKPFTAQSVSAASTVWTPASGKRPRLLGFSIAGSVIGDYTLTNGTATYIFSEGVAGTAVNSPPGFGNGIPSSVSNTTWSLKGPVGATTPCVASGTIHGTEE